MRCTWRRGEVEVFRLLKEGGIQSRVCEVDMLKDT